MVFGDIDTTRVDIALVCPQCGRETRATVIAEELASFTLRADGAYVDDHECAQCVLS